jgi:hypothetical protein
MRQRQELPEPAVQDQTVHGGVLPKRVLQRDDLCDDNERQRVRDRRGSLRQLLVHCADLRQRRVRGVRIECRLLGSDAGL